MVITALVLTTAHFSISFHITGNNRGSETIVESSAVFDGGGVRGFDPPQEVADPQKVLQNLFGGRL